MTVEKNYAIATFRDRLKISRQFFNKRDAKRIATCTCDFLHALKKLQVIGGNLSIALFTPM